jgi:hypothetical protein
MQAKPEVKITFTVGDLKHQPGMVVQTEVKAGRRGYARKGGGSDSNGQNSDRSWGTDLSQLY